MNKRTKRALTSAIAMFSLLAFVCLSWTIKQFPPAISELQSVSKAHHVYCAGPSSAASYLSEVKPRFTAFVAAAGALAEKLTQQAHNSEQYSFHTQLAAVTNVSRPLWLINRSLLI
jgi:hypothetical protein